MPDVSDILIPLKCSECGGKIEIEGSKWDDSFFFSSDNNSIVFVGANTPDEYIVCTHCGTQFVSRTKFEKHPDGATIFAALAGDKSVVVQGSGIVVNTGSGAVNTAPGGVAAGAGGLAVAGSVGEITVDDGEITITVRGKR